MLKLSRKTKIIFILIVIILATSGYYFYDKHHASGYAGGGFPPTAVNAINIQTQPWQKQIEATGTLNPVQGTMITSAVAGRVTKINFKSGDHVNAGDILIEIDPGILQAQFQAALAKQQLNEGNYKRAIALAKRGFLSQQDLATAKENMEVSIANAKSVQAQLDQNIIHAPFAGKLGVDQVNVGEYLQAGQPIVNLQTLNPLRVDFVVPESDYGKVNVNDKILLKSSSLPHQAFTGNISAIDSAVNIPTRTVAVRAIVANPEEKLLPGAFAQVTVFTGKAQPELTLPETALVFDAAGNYVYKIINGHAQKVLVKVLERNNQQIAVQSPELHIGDQVITVGQLKVSNGAPVYVVH